MSQWKNYKRSYEFVRPYVGFLAVSAVLAIITVLLTAVVRAWLLPIVITTLSANTGKPTVPKEIFDLGHFHLKDYLNFITTKFIQKENPQSTLTFICALILVASFFNNVVGYGQTLIMNKINLSMVRDMRNRLFAHVLKLPVSYYDRNRSGSVMSYIINDVNGINSALTNTFNTLLTQPFTLFLYVGILFITSWKLTLIAGLTAPLLVIIITKTGSSVRRRSKRALNQFSGLFSVLHEVVACIRVVKMFNMNKSEHDKFKVENEKFVKTSFKSTVVGAAGNPMIDTLGYVVALILVWYGGKMVFSESITSVDFLRFIVVSLSVYPPIKSLSNVNNAIQGGLAAMERVYTLLDTKPETLVSVDTPKPPHFSRDIIFSKVKFTYPECKDEVLHGVDIAINKGDICAIVGPSGSGKSTILDLVPRFYEITGGTITLDGVDIASMDLISLRSLFGIVAQETVLFNASVFDNIAYGMHNVSREQVISAAKSANAWEFVEKLPKELETIVGERGVMLSGGQRQRLSIARALLKNPPILILDEATSALDTESERLVQHAINNLMENRTVLVVAHRLSTVQHANQIVVLEAGNIVERGTHAELLGLGNRYKYYYNIQFNAPKKAGVA